MTAAEHYRRQVDAIEAVCRDVGEGQGEEWRRRLTQAIATTYPTGCSVFDGPKYREWLRARSDVLRRMFPDAFPAKLGGADALFEE